MSYAHIKNGIVISVILLCVLLIVSAIQFALYDEVAAYLYQLISLSVAAAVIIGAHVWSTAYENTVGLQKLLIAALHIELLFSLLLVTVLIFDGYGFYKTLIIFLAFQAGHGFIYLGNMFLYDEKPIYHKPLSNEEIRQKSKKTSIDPSIQEGSD